MNRTRRDGFYWIKPNSDSEWETAEFHGNSWELIGEILLRSDAEIFEIDERPVVREEPLTPKIEGTTERIPQNE